MNQQAYLLDNNICAFYLRGKFDVDKRIDHVGWDNCYISEITMTKDFFRFQGIRLENWINR